MIRNGMLCVGCPIGTFHTVAEACLAHAVDEAAFSAELLSAMTAGT
jgi:hybrid cluster-associated redox disulfide protein